LVSEVAAAIAGCFASILLFFVFLFRIVSITYSCWSCYDSRRRSIYLLG
jgi:hypothetical protein